VRVINSRRSMFTQMGRETFPPVLTEAGSSCKQLRAARFVHLALVYLPGAFRNPVDPVDSVIFHPPNLPQLERQSPMTVSFAELNHRRKKAGLDMHIPMEEYTWSSML